MILIAWAPSLYVGLFVNAHLGNYFYLPGKWSPLLYRYVYPLTCLLITVTLQLYLLWPRLRRSFRGAILTGGLLGVMCFAQIWGPKIMNDSLLASTFPKEVALEAFFSGTFAAVILFLLTDVRSKESQH
jgi:hypothetical protein